MQKTVYKGPCSGLYNSYTFEKVMRDRCEKVYSPKSDLQILHEQHGVTIKYWRVKNIATVILFSEDNSKLSIVEKMILQLEKEN